MSLRLRFCVSRKGGTGSEDANSMTVSGLHGRKVLAGTVRAISVVLDLESSRPAL